MGRVRWIWVGLAAALAALAYAWTELPDGRFPTHWSGPEPDGWSTRNGFVLQLGLVILAIAALFLLLARHFARSESLSGLNVPGKEYWTRPENLEQGKAMAVQDMDTVGGLTLALFAALPLVILAASRQGDGRFPTWGAVVIGGYVLAMVVWLVRLLTRWRPPDRG